jgi:hypothetical protein
VFSVRERADETVFCYLTPTSTLFTFYLFVSWLDSTFDPLFHPPSFPSSRPFFGVCTSNLWGQEPGHVVKTVTQIVLFFYCLHFSFFWLKASEVEWVRTGGGWAGASHVDTGRAFYPATPPPSPLFFSFFCSFTHNGLVCPSCDPFRSTAKQSAPAGVPRGQRVPNRKQGGGRSGGSGGSGVPGCPSSPGGSGGHSGNQIVSPNIPPIVASIGEYYPTISRVKLTCLVSCIITWLRSLDTHLYIFFIVIMFRLWYKPMVKSRGSTCNRRGHICR